MNTNKLISIGCVSFALALGATSAVASSNASFQSREPVVFAYIGDSNVDWVKGLPNATLITENRCNTGGMCSKVAIGYSAPNPSSSNSDLNHYGTPQSLQTAGASARNADTTAPKTIFGGVGDPRGDLIKQLPLARIVTEHRCTDGVCAPVVIGYLAPVPSDLKRYTASAARANTQALENGAHIAAASDAVTTIAGLAGGAVEANPLMGASPSLAAIVGMTALKMAYVDNMAKDTSRTPLQKIDDLCGASAVMGAASFNNLAVMAGGVGALPVLVGMAASQYQYGACVSKATAQPTPEELAENAALAQLIHTAKFTESVRSTEVAQR